MKIIKSDDYIKSLRNILRYIANDKVSASRRFELELNKRIKNLVHFPEKFRQSEYFDDKNIRDMIYKGYTVIYEIDSENDTIEILDIFNRNKPPQVEK